MYALEVLYRSTCRPSTISGSNGAMPSSCMARFWSATEVALVESKAFSDVRT
jgi:hypothetical protein